MLLEGCFICTAPLICSRTRGPMASNLQRYEQRQSPHHVFSPHPQPRQAPPGTPSPWSHELQQKKDVFCCIFAAWRVSIGTVLLVLCHMPLCAGCPAYSCLSFSMGATFPPPAEIFPSDSTWLLPSYRSSCDSDPRTQLPFLFLSFFFIPTAGIILRMSKSVSSKEHTS